MEGSLAGFADDFGRSYSSTFDAMKRCKEGILIYLKYIRNDHIKRLDFYLISNRCVIFTVKDCKGITNINTKEEIDQTNLGEGRQLNFYLTAVPIWTLRSSVSIPRQNPNEYSMFRSCFDGEGIESKDDSRI